LAALAIYLQAEKKQTFATPNEVQAIFSTTCKGTEATHLLAFAISAGLLERSGEAFRFSHQLLQEYFAAYAIDAELRRGNAANQYFPGEEWWKPTVFDEPIVVLVGIRKVLQDPESDPWKVMDWLAPVNPILAWRGIAENDLDQSHPSARVLME